MTKKETRQRQQRASSARYYEAHRAEVLAEQRVYYAAVRATILARARERYAARHNPSQDRPVAPRLVCQHKTCACLREAAGQRLRKLIRLHARDERWAVKRLAREHARYAHLHPLEVAARDAAYYEAQQAAKLATLRAEHEATRALVAADAVACTFSARALARGTRALARGTRPATLGVC